MEEAQDYSKVGFGGAGVGNQGEEWGPEPGKEQRRVAHTCPLWLKL